MIYSLSGFAMKSVLLLLCLRTIRNKGCIREVQSRMKGSWGPPLSVLSKCASRGQEKSKAWLRGADKNLGALSGSL